MRIGRAAVVVGFLALSAFAAPAGRRTEPPGFGVRPARAAAADRRTVREGNVAFALDVLRALGAAPGDVAFSPASLSTALAMTAEGAAGNTRAEVVRALHADLPPGRLGRAFQSVLAEVRPGPDIRLGVANALWSAVGGRFRPSFRETLRRRCGARVAEADFAGDPGGSRDDVNRWASDRTDGRVEELLPPGVYDADTAFVLANAVAFAAPWEQPFEEQAHEPFSLRDGRSVDVTTLRQEGAYRRAVGDGYEAVEIPYRGGAFSMLVLVPRGPAGARLLDADVAPETLRDAIAGLEPEILELHLPAFGFETSLELESVLRGLGVVDAFDPYAADFGAALSPGAPAFVDRVLQRASVRVDAEGTVAVAVTVVVVGGLSTVGLDRSPRVVRIDRPFVFLIRHRRSGTILFAGRVEDPR